MACLSRHSATLLLAALLLFEHCGVYSFSGVAIAQDIKTLTIIPFYNNALLGPNDMNNMITEKIRQYFERNTSLSSVNEGGDIQISGQIDSYTLSPVAPTSSGELTRPDYSTLTRLTIVASVTYTNNVDDTFNFEGKNFSFFVDFDENYVDFSSEERTFTEEVIDQIVLDIFNQSLGNW